MDVTNLARATPFSTKDGLQIRELVHPSWTNARKKERDVAAAAGIVRPASSTSS